MMLIKVTEGCSGERFSFSRGKEYEVSNDLGLNLINAGFAIKVEREKPIAQAPEIVKTIVQPEVIEIKKAVVFDKKRKRK